MFKGVGLQFHLSSWTLNPTNFWLLLPACYLAIYPWFGLHLRLQMDIYKPLLKKKTSFTIHNKAYCIMNVGYLRMRRLVSRARIKNRTKVSNLQTTLRPSPLPPQFTASVCDHHLCKSCAMHKSPPTCAWTLMRAVPRSLLCTAKVWGWACAKKLSGTSGKIISSNEGGKGMLRCFSWKNKHHTSIPTSLFNSQPKLWFVMN